MVTIKMTTAATKLDRTIDVLHAADRSLSLPTMRSLRGNL
jgi:hypothetical protein